jgi:hypothetical protein
MSSACLRRENFGSCHLPVGANLWGLKGLGVAFGSFVMEDAESGGLEGEAADGRIAGGGYFAKNRINRGGRLLARAI